MLLSPPGDDRRLRLRELERGIDVDAAHHPVAPDVGVDDRLDAVLLELLRQVDHVVPGHLGPALHGDLAVLRVEPRDDVAGKGVAGIGKEPGFFTAAVPTMT